MRVRVETKVEEFEVETTDLVVTMGMSGRVEVKNVDLIRQDHGGDLLTTPLIAFGGVLLKGVVVEEWSLARDSNLRRLEGILVGDWRLERASLRMPDGSRLAVAARSVSVFDSLQEFAKARGKRVS